MNEFSEKVTEQIDKEFTKDNTKLTPRAIFGASKLALKVKKSTGFRKKSGVFMVAEAGLDLHLLSARKANR